MTKNPAKNIPAETHAQPLPLMIFLKGIFS
jgi:hypothetical protein